jgi:hypothetical protein
MSDAVKRISAGISESEISRSRDFQADSALASGRASGNQLAGPLRADIGLAGARSMPQGQASRQVADVQADVTSGCSTDRPPA